MGWPPPIPKAFREAKKLKEPCGGALFFAGDHRYRKVTLRTDARRKAAA